MVTRIQGLKQIRILLKERKTRSQKENAKPDPETKINPDPEERKKNNIYLKMKMLNRIQGLK